MPINLEYWFNKGYSDYPSNHPLHDVTFDSNFKLPGYFDISEEWRQKNTAYWRGWNNAKQVKPIKR
ncbi:MAG: hypothetical protein J0649_11425 [Methylococcales bacterium]|jgi:hypothetical protein|nr:hypothetical protein [Methylococcales bacterium]